MRATAFVILLSVVLFAATAQAVVPGLISYQGTLTDDGGVVLDTTVAMTFTIYYDSTGATAIWNETQPSVVVTDGIFNVLLGSVNPLSEGLFGGTPSRWLGVQVGGDPELTPRQRIVTVAHAFHAAVAETADYAHSAPAAADGDWTILGDHLVSAVPGSVGIGTSPPQARLDVAGEINAASVYQIGGTSVLSSEGTDNIFVGEGAGQNNTGGFGNTFVGSNAGLSNGAGDVNTFVGADAGESNTEGYYNTFIGRAAGNMNLTGAYNTFVGGSAGRNNTSGHSNIFMGVYAGNDNTEGAENIFVGHYSGLYNEYGGENTYVGGFSGYQNVAGNYNVCLGRGAGYSNTSSNNTHLGTRSGYTNVSGHGNVFLGYRAGYYETGAEKLYIANDRDTADVLIYGDFSTGRVGIGTMAPSYPLHVVNPSPDNHSRAIYGVSTSSGTGQQIWGVAGEVQTSTVGNAGAGVFGFATNATGAACGVRGESASESGRGVRAWATHTTGLNYGIYAETSSPNGYAGYFRGGMNYFQGDVGIGYTVPSHTLDVAGDINANGALHLNGFSVMRRSFTNNLMVGRGAGENNTGDHNTFVGDSTGVNNQDDGCTFLGTWAGYHNTTGQNNTFLGMAAGYENTTGDFNTCVGVSAGGDINGGFSNVFLGHGAGSKVTTGDGNVFLGKFSGYNNITGNNNVFIGLQAGYNETGSEKLYIANGPNDADVLIYGDFATGRVGIGTTAPVDDLEVVGEVDITSAVNTQVLDIYSTAYTSGQMVNVQTSQNVSSGGDILQLKMGSTSSATCQFIECERGSDVEFRVDGDGDVFADGVFTPGGADVAEMIAVSAGAATVEPGDVMVIDPGSLRATRKATEPRSTLVAGIHSTKPGVLGSERDWDKPAKDENGESGIYTMEEMAAQFNEVPLAVVGIVPCKVSAENGAIKPGDLLVTSATPGHAMRDEDPKTGTVVGKALESLPAGTGLIRVLVTLQ